MARLAIRLADMTPFFRMLERQSGALEVGIRESWESSFDTPAKLAPATIKARRDRKGYYENEPGPRAKQSGPPFYWTGNLQKSAMKFTTIDANKATIDPDANYSGPIEGSTVFSDIISESGISDENIWDDERVGDRISRDLSAYLFGVLEKS